MVDLFGTIDDAVNDAQDAVDGAVSDAQDSFDGAVSDAQDTVDGAVTTFSGTVDDAQQAADDALGGVDESIARQFDDQEGGGFADEAVDTATETFEETSETVEDTIATFSGSDVSTDSDVDDSEIPTFADPMETDPAEPQPSAQPSTGGARDGRQSQDVLASVIPSGSSDSPGGGALSGLSTAQLAVGAAALLAAAYATRGA